jgi:hypothetical protein
MAKNSLAEKMRQHFAEHDVVRYAHVTEAWVTYHDEETHRQFMRGNITVPRPRFDPERKEVVALHAEDRSGAIAGTREIIRPQARKPYLGRLETGQAGNLGRYANMLPTLTLN